MFSPGLQSFEDMDSEFQLLFSIGVCDCLGGDTFNVSAPQLGGLMTSQAPMLFKT